MSDKEILDHLLNEQHYDKREKPPSSGNNQVLMEFKALKIIYSFSQECNVAPMQFKKSYSNIGILIVFLISNPKETVKYTEK